MKNYIYILIFFSMLFTACKDPNATGPNTDVTINEVVDYEVIDVGYVGLELEEISENIIRNEVELNSLIMNNNFTTNPALTNRLKNIDFDNNTLVIIAGRSVAEQTRITLDTIYVDANGKLQLDYRVYRKLGISQKEFYPALIVLIKNRKSPELRLRRKDITEGKTPLFDGFETIATDIQVNTRQKWKSVFRTANEFRDWATEFNATNTDFINEVDFEKEMVISVGTGRFTSGEYRYTIQEIQQQGNRLIVHSAFSVINHQVDITKPNNHFVKINKTNLSISFLPSIMFNIVNPTKEFYYENFKLINLEAQKETKESVTKIRSYSELFSVIQPSDELTTNVEIDFEFFDLIVIKAPTHFVGALKHEVDYIKRDNMGISGKVTLFPNFTGTSQKIDTYVLIKILKTNIPLSENFEVIIK